MSSYVIVSELDPGIVAMVTALNEYGFRTVDSGDGVSKPPSDEVLPFRHVVCRVPTGEFFFYSKYMQNLLNTGHLPPGNWAIEATYHPATDVALITIGEL